MFSNGIGGWIIERLGNNLLSRSTGIHKLSETALAGNVEQPELPLARGFSHSSTSNKSREPGYQMGYGAASCKDPQGISRLS